MFKYLLCFINKSMRYYKLCRCNKSELLKLMLHIHSCYERIIIYPLIVLTRAWTYNDNKIYSFHEYGSNFVTSHNIFYNM